jgi:methionine sulfoxide reductase heme-binding subunit
MSASDLAWYAVRASGYTALILLTLSMVIGLLLSLHLQSPRWPRWLTNDLHAFVSLVSLIFIAIHVVTTIIDPYIHFGLAGALVPFATGYATWGMAFGIVAAYLMLAVWISSQLQRQIGWRTWRTLHFSVYGVYVFSIAHTIMAGEDASGGWGRWIALVSVSIIGGLTALRMLSRPRRAAGRPHSALSTDSDQSAVASTTRARRIGDTAV